MVYNNLNDISRKKAALRAELKIHEKNISSLKTALLAKPAAEKKGVSKKGIMGLVNTKNIVTTSLTALDYGWFLWKMYKKLKHK